VAAFHSRTVAGLYFPDVAEQRSSDFCSGAAGDFRPSAGAMTFRHSAEAVSSPTIRLYGLAPACGVRASMFHCTFAAQLKAGVVWSTAQIFSTRLRFRWVSRERLWTRGWREGFSNISNLPGLRVRHRCVQRHSRWISRRSGPRFCGSPDRPHRESSILAANRRGRIRLQHRSTRRRRTFAWEAPLGNRKDMRCRFAPAFRLRAARRQLRMSLRLPSGASPSNVRRRRVLRCCNPNPAALFAANIELHGVGRSGEPQNRWAARRLIHREWRCTHRGATLKPGRFEIFEKPFAPTLASITALAIPTETAGGVERFVQLTQTTPALSCAATCSEH